MANYTTNILSKYQALQFNGVGEYVSLGNTYKFTDVNGDLPFSIEALVKISGDTVIFSKAYGDEANWEYILRISNNTVIFLFFNGFSGADIIRRDVPYPNDGEYHLVSATYDGSASQLGISIYIDGIYVEGTSAITTYNGMRNDVNNEVHIGASGVTNPSGFTGYSNGIVDELKIWNMELPQQEIQSNMNKSLTGAEMGLVGYYPMNEGLGNWTYDHTGNGNNGTINGGNWTPKVGFKPIKIIESGNTESPTPITTAMEFTGGYLSIPHDDEHNITQFTLETYMRKSDINDSGIWFKRGSGNNGWAVGVMSTGIISFTVFGVATYSTSYSIPDTNFHRISIVYDVNTVNVYVDGTLVDILSVSSLSITTMPTRISAATDNDGSVTSTSNTTQTDLRFWNVIRTKQEIQDNLNVRLNGDETGLYGYWKMDEITNGQVLDLTSNVNHAVVTNEINISIINI